MRFDLLDRMFTEESDIVCMKGRVLAVLLANEIELRLSNLQLRRFLRWKILRLGGSVAEFA